MQKRGRSTWRKYCCQNATCKSTESRYTHLELDLANVRILTQLVRDSQFSPLGLALLAEVARLQHATLRLRQEFRHIAYRESVGLADAALAVSPSVSDPSTDIGEVISRSEPVDPIIGSLEAFDIDRIHSKASTECAERRRYLADTKGKSAKVVSIKDDAKHAPFSPKISESQSETKSEKQVNFIDDLFAVLE